MQVLTRPFLEPFMHILTVSIVYLRSTEVISGKGHDKGNIFVLPKVVLLTTCVSGILQASEEF